MRTLRYFFTGALYFSLTWGCSPELKSPQLTDEEPVSFECTWIRIPPQEMRTTAGYGHIINRTTSPLVIESLETESAKRVEIHKTEVVNGMSRMRKINKMSIPARETLILKPGSYHFMFFGFNNELIGPGKVTIHFKGGLSKEINFRLDRNGINKSKNGDSSSRNGC